MGEDPNQTTVRKPGPLYISILSESQTLETGLEKNFSSPIRLNLASFYNGFLKVIFLCESER